MDVMAQTQRALLTVDDLEGAILAVSPIHHVQRETHPDGRDDRLLLRAIVDERALIRRADIESPRIPAHPLIAIVLVTLRQLTHCNMTQRNLHFHFLLRIRIRL